VTVQTVLAEDRFAYLTGFVFSEVGIFYLTVDQWRDILWELYVS